MKSLTIATLLTFITLAVAQGPPFDPAGVPNVGNGQGKQFIGGQCLNAADCGSGCCAGPAGICSGPGASTQNGKTGCGFGGGSAAPPPAAPPATSSSGDGPPFDPAGAPHVGNGQGGQFIGGQCLSAADCASGCCAGPRGICSGPGASTQNGKTGCGFTSGSVGLQAAPAPAAAPPAAPASGTGPPFDPAGVKNVGNGQQKQFIGGQCLSTADCASGCCAGPAGICSGPGASTQNGKTGCGFNAKRFLKMRELLD